MKKQEELEKEARQHNHRYPSTTSSSKFFQDKAPTRGRVQEQSSAIKPVDKIHSPAATAAAAAVIITQPEAAMVKTSGISSFFKVCYGVCVIAYVY